VILTRRPGDSREIVKILDFGIAKVREATIELTRQDAILGTPQYMAPEQASGHLGEIDERTDQFSLAAMAYELVTGEPPFGGKTPAAILYQVVHEAPRPFRLPLAATEAVILRGMSKSKAQRFPSMREFHQALVEAAAADPWPPVPVNPTLIVEPRVDAKATESEAREPTAILPGKGTTLSKATRPLTVEPASKVPGSPSEGRTYEGSPDPPSEGRMQNSRGRHAGNCEGTKNTSRRSPWTRRPCAEKCALLEAARIARMLNWRQALEGSTPLPSLLGRACGSPSEGRRDPRPRVVRMKDPPSEGRMQNSRGRHAGNCEGTKNTSRRSPWTRRPCAEKCALLEAARIARMLN
jgi:serine/threonine protein kinase